MCLSAAAIPSAGEVEEVNSPAENLMYVNSNSTGFGEEDHNYLANMTTLYNYLHTIEDITRPGCSSEVLDAALESMSQIVVNLSRLSSSSRHHTSH